MTRSTMTCRECLQLVSTADITELTTATAITEHCGTCADCAVVVDEVAQEVRRLGSMLDGTPPGVAAHVVAMQAVARTSLARRRTRLHRALVTALVAGGFVIGAVVIPRFGVVAEAKERRTIELQCLSPERAAALAAGALPSGVALEIRPVDLPIIQLEGTREDIATARQVLLGLDAKWGAERSGYCTVTPSAGAPTVAPK